MASSTKEITFDELLRAPGAIVDVQRVVQNLPSVASGGDKTNEIIVRGGLPGENLFVLDNIELPNPTSSRNKGVAAASFPLSIHCWSRESRSTRARRQPNTAAKPRACLT